MKSGMVFSPHFDDETLGCGGTIIRKTDAGVPISVVFMTDGRRSHSQWISEDELSQMRKSEGVAAVGELGVKRENVFILGFPESKLMEYSDRVHQEVTNLLTLQQPEQVFLPYTEEPLMWSSDHILTTKIILDAIRSCSWKITVYEYPIWAWFHYPWIRPQRGSLRQVLKNSIEYRFGIRLLSDFNFKANIEDVLDRKMSALERHRSQMVELIPDVGWPTLRGVANGDFLKLFFQKYEYFRRN
jgi:LmbE family N-acetylglucosaminyl deacetylase